MEKKLEKIEVSIPETWIRKLDELVSKGYYPNRREAIMLAIRDMVKKNASWGIEVSKELKDRIAVADKDVEWVGRSRK